MNDPDTQQSTNEPDRNSMGSDTDLFGAAPVQPKRNRYPHCLVWTPVPCLTWLFPLIGHLGIATTSGVIRDFAKPYTVNEDAMLFGNPVTYWQLDVSKARNGKDSWDRSVATASEEFSHKMHKMCCDNCYTHVARALNLMNYDNSTSWNMAKLCILMTIHGKYISFGGFFKTWLPFLLIVGVILIIVFVTKDV